MQTQNNLVQWKRTGDDLWNNLFDLNSIKGENGKNLVLQTQNNNIQWKHEGQEDNEWQNLISLNNLMGPSGKNISLRKGETHIEWQVEDSGDNWNQLIDLNSLKVPNVLPESYYFHYYPGEPITDEQKIILDSIKDNSKNEVLSGNLLYSFNYQNKYVTLLEIYNLFTSDHNFKGIIKKNNKWFPILISEKGNFNNPKTIPELKDLGYSDFIIWTGINKQTLVS